MFHTYAFRSLIILLTAPFVVHAANICDSDNIKRLAADKGIYQSSEDLFSSVGKRSNLHVIGETHFYTDTALLSRIVSELASQISGKRKCVFLELPKDGLKNFEELFEKYRKRPNLSPEELKKIEYWSKYYPSLVQSAEKNGLTVFEIDHPGHIDGSKTEVERNEAMAKIAQQLLTDSTCDSAIFFVGKAHISPLENHPSVVSLIKALGLKPITYNLSDLSEQSDFRLSSWGNLVCSPRDVLPNAFSNELLLPETRLYPYLPSERKPIWNDFDFSITR